MTDRYHNAYYAACYELRREGDPVATNGPVHVLLAAGRWTREARTLPAEKRRALLSTPPDPEPPPRRLSSGVFRMDPGRCERCGGVFVGPPNRRYCDGCSTCVKKRGRG